MCYHHRTTDVGKPFHACSNFRSTDGWCRRPSSRAPSMPTLPPPPAVPTRQVGCYQFVIVKYKAQMGPMAASLSIGHRPLVTLSIPLVGTYACLPLPQGALFRSGGRPCHVSAGNPRCCSPSTTSPMLRHAEPPGKGLRAGAPASVFHPYQSSQYGQRWLGLRLVP